MVFFKLALPAEYAWPYLLVLVQGLEVLPDLGLSSIPGHVFEAGSVAEGESAGAQVH